VRKLPGYFELNDLGTSLVARRGDRRYRLGDAIDVKVSDIDRPAGKIEIALP
jgi:exoribonuclease R